MLSELYWDWIQNTAPSLSAPLFLCLSSSSDLVLRLPLFHHRLISPLPSYSTTPPRSLFIRLSLLCANLLETFQLPDPHWHFFPNSLSPGDSDTNNTRLCPQCDGGIRNPARTILTVLRLNRHWHIIYNLKLFWSQRERYHSSPLACRLIIVLYLELHSRLFSPSFVVLFSLLGPTQRPLNEELPLLSPTGWGDDWRGLICMCLAYLAYQFHGIFLPSSSPSISTRPHQMQLVALQPVRPAASLLLAALHTQQLVALPAHRGLWTQKRRLVTVCDQYIGRNGASTSLEAFHFAPTEWICNLRNYHAFLKAGSSSRGWHRHHFTTSFSTCITRNQTLEVQ